MLLPLLHPLSPPPVSLTCLHLTWGQASLQDMTRQLLYGILLLAVNAAASLAQQLFLLLTMALHLQHRLKAWPYICA